MILRFMIIHDPDQSILNIYKLDLSLQKLIYQYLVGSVQHYWAASSGPACFVRQIDGLEHLPVSRIEAESLRQWGTGRCLPSSVSR